MFQFHGYPKYLEDAGKALGYSLRVIDRSRRQVAVGECATQLSQVMSAHPAARREIMSHALERAQALEVASVAARAMYDEMHDEAFPPEPVVVAAVEPDPDSAIAAIGFELNEDVVVRTSAKPNRTRKVEP